MLVQGTPAWLLYDAWNTSTNAYQTGDSGNQTLRFVSDGAVVTPTNAPFEVDGTNRPGLYAVATTSAETLFNLINVGGKSSTVNVVLIDRTYTFGATSLAQVGVNVIQVAGATAVSSLALGNVNVVKIAGLAPATSAIQGNVNVISVQGLGAVSSLALGNVNTVQFAGAGVQLDGNNLPKVDLEDIAGAAVNTGAAQLGVNAVNIGGAVAASSLATGGVNLNQVHGVGVVTSAAQIGVNVVTVGGAAPATSAIAGNVNVVSVQGLSAVSSLALGNVNTLQFAGQGVQLDANNLPNVNVADIAGAVVNTGVAQVGVNLVNVRGSQVNTLISGRVDANAQQLGAGSIATGTFQAAALATTVFASNFLTAALVDSTTDNAIADALLDRANAIETGITPRQAWRITGASAAGALSGAGTTQVGIWGLGVSTTRISAVTDQSGNRVSVSLTP